MHDENAMPECYMQVKPLPPECWPAWVVREDGATLVTVDPSSTRVEIMEWCADHLSVPEMNAYRYAYRQPLVGRPVDDWWMEHECFPSQIPPSIRLQPAAPAAAYTTNWDAYVEEEWDTA